MEDRIGGAAAADIDLRVICGRLDIPAVDLIAAFPAAGDPAAFFEVLGLLHTGCPDSDARHPDTVFLRCLGESSFPGVIRKGRGNEEHERNERTQQCEELVHGKTPFLPSRHLFYYITFY